jgi:hypothetical protein
LRPPYPPQGDFRKIDVLKVPLRGDPGLLQLPQVYTYISSGVGGRLRKVESNAILLEEIIIHGAIFSNLRKLDNFAGEVWLLPLSTYRNVSVSS